MAKDIIVELKAWLPYFYSNGEWLEKPVLKFNGRNVDDEVVDFIEAILHTFIDGGVNDCTLIWLKSNMPSVQKAFEFYNSQCDEVDRINIKTAQSKIFYDKSRLAKYFEDGMLFNLMAYPEIHLSSAWENLDSFNRKYFNDKEYRDAMVLKIDNSFSCDKLDDDSWAGLLSLIKTYSKDQVRAIESGKAPEVSVKMLGYYNYLISSKRLSRDDKERLGQLRKVLGIGQ